MFEDLALDPDNLQLSTEEEELVALGRCLAQSGQRVPQKTMAPILARYQASEVVELIAFAGIMVATNMVNNALEVELDAYLHPYRSAQTSGDKND